MKAQIKSTLIQIVVGATVVVVGLLALNKFVPAFTLFPKETEVKESATSQDEKIPEHEEAAPDETSSETPDDDLVGSEFEEEEPTAPIIEIPQSTKPNTQYKPDKLLKVKNFGSVKPIEIMRNAKRETTINFYNELCERNALSYQKEIELYFALKEKELSDAILFFAAKVDRKVYYFKPQGIHNLLKIPNNYKDGNYKIEYGYILKKEVNNREIPFYSRVCQVTVVD
ncbi:MAG: hypothetical protein AB8G11_22575 [Saprospiraceae bacterium]